MNGGVMCIETAHTEVVYETQILKDHFKFVYQLFADKDFIQPSENLWRAFTGISYPFHNVVFGESLNVTDEVNYFHQKAVPFAWYLDAQTSANYRKSLEFLGFQCIGTFQGMLGSLSSYSDNLLSQEFTIELIDTESAMQEFTDLVCDIFAVADKTGYEKLLWRLANKEMYHWGARKDGKIISALTSCIQGNLMSFWNSATHPKYRHQGLSTALWHAAIQHALSKGCKKGASYLMSDGMALGICSKLGYRSRWRFDVLLPPKIPEHGHSK
jgi:GNAT superfamily N-acetyltransferase